jgi:phosphoribosylamine--glycine ligase
MGDPETEVVMPRLKNDIVELLVAAAHQKLDGVKIETDGRTAVTVMAVSGGYPGEYEKGVPIDGLDLLQEEEALIFQAGTKQEGDGIVTNGGRVLTVTSFGDSIKNAAERSKAILEVISFDGMYFRKDIGYEFYQ